MSGNNVDDDDYVSDAQDDQDNDPIDDDDNPADPQKDDDDDPDYPLDDADDNQPIDDDDDDVEPEDEKEKKFDPNDLTIGPVEGLTEPEQLRRWKKKAHKMREWIKKLRAVNNKYRNRLKKLGDRADKMVDSNLRRQQLYEKKSQGYNYLNEQRILKEIVERGKNISEFKDKLDVNILNKLVTLNGIQQQNNQVRKKLELLKSKSQNLNFTEQINELKNQLTLLQSQVKEQVDDNKRQKLIQTDQELQIEQMYKNFDYKAKLEDTKKQLEKLKTDYRATKKQSIVIAMRNKKQQESFTIIQRMYRKTCVRLKIMGDDRIIMNPEMEAEMLKRQELLKLTQPDPVEPDDDPEPPKNPPEEKPKSAEELFKEDPKGSFEKVLADIKELDEKIATFNEKYSVRKLENEQKLVKLEEEALELMQLLKQKEFDAKIHVGKLNKAQRDIQLTQTKQPIEQVKSAHLKPQMELKGVKDVSQSAITFDDSLVFDWAYEAPIKEISIYVNQDELIMGIQASYLVDVDNKEVRMGPLNINAMLLLNPTYQITKRTLKIADGDNLNFISGFYNKEQIIFLRLETVNRESIYVGNTTSKDKVAQEFRIDVKDKVPIAITGVLDYTKESNGPSERFLVAIGLKLKSKELDIKGKKRVQRQLKEDAKKSVSTSNRKVHYVMKKHQHKQLQLVQSVPEFDKSVIEDPNNNRYTELMLKEKERLQRIKLGLYTSKAFSPSSYKESEYKIESKKRNEATMKRNEQVEKVREEIRKEKLQRETRSAQVLPSIQPTIKKGDDKQKKQQPSPQKQQAQPKKGEQTKKK